MSMLGVKNITKKFGGVTALNRCTLEIGEKQITALVGPNGAGKTTLFDVISGLVEADSGAIQFDNQNLLGLSPQKVTQLGISRTWQQVRLFKNLSIEDHLKMAADDEDTKLLRNMLVSSKHLSTIRTSTSLELGTKTLSTYVEHFGIDRPPSTVVSELSYGQRKLLQLAMIALQPHKIMLLDEPVAGVNKVIQEKIEKMLLHLKAMGETIVVIEHDMEFVKKLADHVIVMHEGKVLIEGRPDVALQDQRVLQAYLGE